MKINSVLIAVAILSASFAQSQTQPGQSAPPAPGQTGSSPNNSVRGRQLGIPRPANPSAPGVGGREDTIFNQPAGANRPQPGQFGGTNQVSFGGTNQVNFGTNNVAFGGTNQTAFGGTNSAVVTNGASPVAGQGRFINEPAGANANTNQVGRSGINPADQAFSQQLRAALAQTGATQIYFPQTRSTITVMNLNGVVTLKGFVANDGERQSIQARIQNTAGVTSVDNQLQINDGQNRGITPRTPGINPAPNSQNDRRLLNP